MADDWFTTNAPPPTTQASKGDWFAANAPEVSEPEKSGGEGALATGGALAALAASVPAARGLAERIVANETLGSAAGKLAGRIATPLNIVKQGYDVVSGKRSLPSAAGNVIAGELGRRYIRPERYIARGVQALQRAAAPVAESLGATLAPVETTTALGGTTMTGVGGAPLAVPLAGGIAGLAIPAAALGAIQHDANRHVDIDYSKQTPDTWIARVLGGRTADERMDDPNDPAFQPDDTATVRAAVIQGLR